MHTVVHGVQVGDGGLEVGLAGPVELRRVTLGLVPGVLPRVGVVPARGGHVGSGADRERVAVRPVLEGLGRVAEAGVRRLVRGVVHVPRLARAGVAAADVVAAGAGRVAPGLAGVLRAVVVARVGRERLPVRVLRVEVVDQVLPGQDRAADRVHVRRVPRLGALRAADQDHLERVVHAVGRRHRHRGGLLGDRRGQVDAAVGGRDLHGPLRGDRGGRRRFRAA